ncbi:MAG: MBL fold metallo-hydrolase [Candidatus Woesearchaeota archaeon]|nr:MAG: MBL fold metallo-hydrolase [Candidatus Woesearchaeota archaeon]
MLPILKEVLDQIPQGKDISTATFEGANIVLYTKNTEFFLDNEGVIRKIVDNIKKRVELRPDPSITKDMEKSEEKILELIPKEAGASNVLFDPQRSIVIIEAEKPGLAIGKQGEVLRKIRKEILWVPVVRRTPALRSKVIENIRQVLFENNDYRKKFLNKIGERIYSGYTKEKKSEWVRVTVLGAGRQVGRSCLLLQTPESKVLLDCGVNIAAPDKHAYPYLDAPEFKIEELDAVIITHQHLDHSGFAPYLYKMGYRGPLYCTEPTRDISALLALDYVGIAFKDAKKAIYATSDIKEMVKHTVCLDYGEVTDVTPDIRITLYNAGHTLGSTIVHLHIGNGMHNLIYSLDWKTPVTVVDNKNNVFFKPIGEVIDKSFEEFPDLIKKKGIYEELPNLDELKTIVFNPKTYKTDIVPVTSFIRHPITEELYELKTASGRSVIVTKSHSVFSVKDGEVVAAKVSELGEGDFILGPKKIPLMNREPVIDLLEHVPKLRVKIDDTKLLTNILERYKPKLRELKENDRKEALNWIIDHFKYSAYKEDIIKKYGINKRRVIRVFNKLGIKDYPRVKHVFTDKLKVTKAFARFLGYYVAEGHSKKNSQTVEVTNYNHKILEDCHDIIKKTFGIVGDLRYRDNAVLFHSKQLKYLLSDVLKCGKGAYTKRVPSQILLASEEIISNFLYGYFSGDGGIIDKKDDSGRCICAASKNKDLMQDITFMLLQFGIVPTLTHNKYTDMYQANIHNSEKIKEFIEKIGIENSHLERLIPNLIRKRNKGSFDLRIPLLSLSKKGQVSLSLSPWQNSKTCGIKHLENMDLPDLDKKLLKSDFMFDQIKEIKKVKSTNKYVYDFKVNNYENFLGGNGFLFLHNTGDFKYGRTMLLEPAVTSYPRLETVIMEGTYGGKDNIVSTYKESEDKLNEIVKKTIERGGKVLIPTLGVGRSQEMMLIIEKSIREGRMQRIPVFVQGMVWDVTAIHTAYPDYLSNQVRKQIFHKDQNPFLSDIFTMVGSYKEQQKIIEESGPCVILATSGMLTAGPSVSYFKALADNPKNSIIFVNYQGEGCLGRQVQQGAKEVVVANGNVPENIKVNMEIYTLDGFSGHSDRRELINFVKRLDPPPKKVIVVHGESSRVLDLASSIHKLQKIETNAPKNLESIRIR